jgi:hypothetical protein
MKSVFVTIPTISPSAIIGIPPILFSIIILAAFPRFSVAFKVIGSGLITVDIWKCEGGIFPYLDEPSLNAISFSVIIPTNSLSFSWFVFITGSLEILCFFMSFNASLRLWSLSTTTTLELIISFICILYSSLQFTISINKLKLSTESL